MLSNIEAKQLAALEAVAKGDATIMKSDEKSRGIDALLEGKPAATLISDLVRLGYVRKPMSTNAKTAKLTKSGVDYLAALQQASESESDEPVVAALHDEPKRTRSAVVIESEGSSTIDVPRPRNRALTDKAAAAFDRALLTLEQLVRIAPTDPRDYSRTIALKIALRLERAELGAREIELYMERDDVTDEQRELLREVPETVRQQGYAYAQAFCDALEVDPYFVAPVDQLQLVHYALRLTRQLGYALPAI